MNWDGECRFGAFSAFQAAWAGAYPFENSSTVPCVLLENLAWLAVSRAPPATESASKLFDSLRRLVCSCAKKSVKGFLQESQTCRFGGRQNGTESEVPCLGGRAS